MITFSNIYNSTLISNKKTAMPLLLCDYLLFNVIIRNVDRHTDIPSYRVAKLQEKSIKIMTLSRPKLLCQ